MKHLAALVSLLVVSLFGLGTGGVEYGIAAKYVRDNGIKGNPSVLFAENFEESSIDEMINTNWIYSANRARMSFSPDKPQNSGGTKSLYISGGWADMYRQLLPGYDTLYVRYYTKMDPSCVGIHHWPFLGGHNPPTTFPWPRAGEKPVGNERFSTAIEPMGTDWRWDFYVYWKDMRPANDGMYWGNNFTLNMDIPANRGEWVCVEWMVKMNTPVTASNGELAMWINGEKKLALGQGFPMGRWAGGGSWTTQCRTCEPFGGFQWRTTTDLKINYFWLEHFVDTDPGCEAWFDDVVISKKYIGPQVNQIVGINPKETSSAVPASFGAKALSASQTRFLLPSDLHGDYSLNLYDLSGKRIWQSRKTGFAGMEVDLHQYLGNGVHVAELSYGDKKAVVRFSTLR